MATGTVRFFRTNSIKDEGVEPEFTEVSEAWWASTTAKEWWAEQSGYRFERVFLPWLADAYGGWNPDAPGQRDAVDALINHVWGDKPLVIDHADSHRKRMEREKRWDDCMVTDCPEKGHPRICPADHRAHHHGAIHLHPKTALATDGWGLICNEHGLAADAEWATAREEVGA